MNHSYKKGTYFEHAEGQMLRFVYIGVNIYFVTNVTYRNVTIWLFGKMRLGGLMEVKRLDYLYNYNYINNLP